MDALSQNAARWLAIWLPRLSTDRLRRSADAPDAPLATYAKEANAFALTCVDARAAALGLHAGMPLADAQAMQPSLCVVEAEPAADARALDAIAAWCERFTPVVAIDSPDGLYLDITGCAHLFGDEESLRADLIARLRSQNFTLRAAIAPTLGAAWALARFEQAESQMRLSSPHRLLRSRQTKIAGSQAIPWRGGVGGGGASAVLADIGADTPLPTLPRKGGGGELLAALAPLPIKALRLSSDSAALLRRLGLKTISQLHGAPRNAFTARAGEHAMLRLDQALGRAPEAVSPRRPPPPLYALRRFVEPLFTVEAILEATKTLSHDLVTKLERRGVGVRRAALHLFGVDGRDRVIEIGVSRPERDVKAILRLFRERLNLSPESIDAEFGIEAARLDAVQIQRTDAVAQNLVAMAEDAESAEKIAALVDVLSARLGPNRVVRPRFRDTHVPERAAGWGAALMGPPASSRQEKEAGWKPAVPGPPADGVMRRPLRVFARPQPIEAIATVPDGPPIRFRWRRVLREVARAEGPERIASEWARTPDALTRDYYRVEDGEGRRYWIFREGLFGEESAAPRWFIQGLFA
ncbi:MAG: DNA polymerase Y family protein [Terricaulis sp.]